MEKKLCIGVMGILIDMIDAVGIEGACPPNEAMNFIALSKQKLC